MIFSHVSLSGVEIEGPIGVNISALELAGVNLTMLADKLRNDTEVDEILSRTNGSTKFLGLETKIEKRKIFSEISEEVSFCLF